MRTPFNASEPIISCREAAKLLGVRPGHVEMLARAGRIEGRKANNVWRLVRHSVERLAFERLGESPDEPDQPWCKRCDVALGQGECKRCATVRIKQNQPDSQTRQALAHGNRALEFYA